MDTNSARNGGPIVVHLSLDELPKRRGQSLEEVISQASRLKACLEMFQTTWERPAADEAVWVGATSTTNTFESVLSWVERLRDRVHQSTDWNASAGIASTRLAARVASRLAKPCGLLLLLPGYENRFLSDVPLEELDELRPAQSAALRRRGLGTLGDLADLDPEEARHLLGPEAVRLLSLVRGGEPRPSWDSTSRLERTLNSLCRRVSKKLEKGPWGARGLELGLVYGDGISLERYTLMPHPVQTAEDIESWARNLLRSFPARPAPVVGCSLTATGLFPQPGQIPLFSRPKDVRVHIGRVF